MLSHSSQAEIRRLHGRQGRFAVMTAGRDGTSYARARPRGVEIEAMVLAPQSAQPPGRGSPTVSPDTFFAETACNGPHSFAPCKSRGNMVQVVAASARVGVRLLTGWLQVRILPRP